MGFFHSLERSNFLITYGKSVLAFENPHLTLKESDVGSLKSSQSKEIAAGYRYVSTFLCKAPI